MSASLRYAVLGAALAPLLASIGGKPVEQVASAAPMSGKAGASSSGARLPWAAGDSVYLTQDANDDCCGDHVGSNKWAWDFAAWDGGAFDVVAPQAGTVVHVKMSSGHGCGDSKCVNDANYLVIDHGDGTQTTLLHLAQGSLDPSVRCGAFVRRGQRLARTGSTGWSTGVHLHVERDQVKKNLKKVCECGVDGLGCAPHAAEWSLFWPSVQQPNVPSRFAEWGSADAPKNRRGMIGPSINVDAREDVLTLELAGRFSAMVGEWTDGGGFRVAKADGKAKARLSLNGAVKKPGLYEVWARVPLGVSMADAAITIETHDPSGQGGTRSAQGQLVGSIPGGAFHPVVGLERVALDGTAASLVFESLAKADGKVLTADAIVLRRAGDLAVDPAAAIAKK